MIQLRELQRTDLPTINRWRQDRALTDQLGAPHRFIGLEIDERWFDAYLSRRGTDVRLAVCMEGRHDPIGLVSLTGIDPVHRHAEFHILLGDREAHGNGAGTAATTAMLHHAFQDLNLHRVYLSVLAGNAAALRVYEKAGFRLEGTAREAAFKSGAYQDLLLMGILASEFTPT
jgi:RimJ/RimL family protein N-acetyltransferase